MASDEPHPGQNPVEGAPEVIDRELEHAQGPRSQDEPASAKPTDGQEDEVFVSGEPNRPEGPVEGDPETIDRELGREGD